MKTPSWNKFLSELIPSRKARQELQLFFGSCLIPPLKKFKVTIALKYQEGLTFSVMARDEQEAKIIAINKPDCAVLIQQRPFVMAEPC